MKGKERTSLLKKNIVGALAVKAGSICCTMLLVPMTINFVNPTQYGIWLTISSVVMWMQFFDIGFSNGLRNKLTEALAKEDLKSGQSFISTTYMMLTIIFSALLILITLLSWSCPITSLLGIESVYEPELKLAMTVLVAYFCCNMVVRTLSYVLMAKQKAAMSSLFDFIGQLFVLLTVWMLNGAVEGSLFYLSLALCIPPLLVWLLASIALYMGPYKELRPKFSLAKLGDTYQLLTLGVKFFIIQIAFIIQFQTSTFLVGRLFSMVQVTSYNLAYRYFNVLYMFFFLAIEPLWCAVTDAWAQGEKEWIRQSIRKYSVLWGAFAIAGLIMLLLSDWAYDFWVNRHVEEQIDMPTSLSLWMFLYVLSVMFGQIFCTFVNGIGALRIQFITSLISPIIFITMTIVLAKVFSMGMECVLIASILANFNGIILAPLQYWKVMNCNKKGIWTA